MTANARAMKPVRESGTLDGILPGESLDDLEKRVGDDIPEATDADFARARPIEDLPELVALYAEAAKRPRPPEVPVDVSPPVAVLFEGQNLSITLADGRVLTMPMTWYPDLVNASPAQRAAFVLTPTGVKWRDFHEQADIADILRTKLKIAELQRARGQRGRQKSPVKDRIGLRLDHDVVAHFRASGPGWQSRINDILVDYVKRNAD